MRGLIPEAAPPISPSIAFFTAYEGTLPCFMHIAIIILES